jgi:hypothetical protein
MNNTLRPILGLVCLSAALWLAAAGALAAANLGQLEFRAIDKASGKPIAARMHLKDAAGKPVKPPQAPFWRDHFVFDGTITLELPPANYTFELECGPEYKLATGNFRIQRDSSDTKLVEMERFVDMKKEGWWSGDLHIHRPLADIELLMRAEDLHVGPVITWWNNRNLWKDQPLPEKLLVQFDGNRFYHLMAGEDEREGGALLYFNLASPLPVAGSQREYPSPVKFLEQARQTPGVHVDIEKPFWWDVPVWVAIGGVDSIGLANNHQNRDGMLDNEAWGKPRDTKRFPSPHGNGRWTHEIYYQLLNCGLRIPPSAGGASGVLPNPVGYNRVYVHCGKELTWDAWWENLRRGQVVVTNGPLLRPRVHGAGAPKEGALPGHVFKADQGQTIDLEIALNLSTRDKIDYLEIIQDGQRIHEVRLDQWAKANGKLPHVTFTKSGWMLVRAVTNNDKTYRFASTGPYYAEIGYDRRVSKKAAQFFLDWVQERAGRIKLDDPAQREEVIAYHRQARDFWQKKVEQANAE